MQTTLMLCTVLGLGMIHTCTLPYSVIPLYLLYKRIRRLNQQIKEKGMKMKIKINQKLLQIARRGKRRRSKKESEREEEEREEDKKTKKKIEKN